MTSTAIELYLYMGNTEEIIKWLKSEGVKTREQARQKLIPYVKSMAMSSMLLGGSLAGASNGSTKILNAFPESVKKTK